MTENEEFEFRKRLEDERKGVSLSGIAEEGGKGLIRGASDTGLGVGKTALSMLFGPVGGKVAGEGLDALSAPSRQLVAANPANKAEQFAGTAGEIGGSGLTGGGAGSVRALAGTALSSLGGAAGEEIGGIPGKIIGTVLPFALGGSKVAAQRLMQSAVKPTIKDLKSGDAARAISTMLDEGISPTAGGMEKLRGKIGELNDQIKTAIANSPASIDKFAVGKHLQDTFDRFVKQVNPTSDIEAIKSAWSEFLNHPMAPGASRIPVQMAQEMKQNTYKVLNKKYGQVGAASDEAQKSIARGLKDEIASAVPEVGPLNAKESDLINALKVGERRALMSLNNNPMGLSLLTKDPAHWAMFMADRSSAFKALVARMLYSGTPNAPTGAKAAMTAESMQQ